MIKFERKWILPLRCATDSVRNLIANSPKKKKAMIIQSDCFIAIIFYMHIYIHYIHRWRWELPTMPK